MKTILLIFLVCIAVSSQARIIVVGSGKGIISVTSMAGIHAGDTLQIRPGVYSGATFKNLNNVSIINGNGLVTFTGTIDFGGNYNGSSGGKAMINVTFTGKGSASYLYGFLFTAAETAVVGTAPHNSGIRFYHCFFQGVGLCFDFSANTGSVKYDGTIASTKLSNSSFSYCRADNCFQFMQGSYSGMASLINIFDSVEWAYDTLLNNASNGNGFFGAYVAANCLHFSIHNNYIHYSGSDSIQRDVGAFVMSGSGKFYKNYVYGGRGYMLRCFGASSSSAPDDTWIFDNIKLATTKYGLADMRSHADDYGTDGHFVGTNFHVIHNTAGNLKDLEHENPFVVPIAVIYQLTDSAKAEVRDNLLFNAAPTNGVAEAIIYDYSGSGRVEESHNMYYPASSIMAELADTNKLCEVRDGSLLIGAGKTIANINTDYSGRVRPNPPAIGAQENANGSQKRKISKISIDPPKPIRHRKLLLMGGIIFFVIVFFAISKFSQNKKSVST